MGGWWRLWVVASVLLGALFVLIQMNVQDVSDYRTGMSRTEAQTWVNDATRRVQICSISGIPKIEAEANGEGLYSGSYYCTSDQQRILAFAWALVPGAALAALGLTLRWVWQGFRKPRE